MRVPRTERVSNAAWDAAHDALDAVDGRSWAGAPRSVMVNLTHEASHDPELGLDRSVCLRTVSQAIRDECARLAGTAIPGNVLLAQAGYHYAEMLERTPFDG